MLPAIAEGRTLIAYGGIDPDNLGAGPPTLAGSTADGFRLNGRHEMVAYAACADHFLLAATVDTDQAAALFVVPAKTPGVSVTGYHTYDGGRAGDLRLDDVMVSAAARLPGDAVETMELVDDHVCAMLCVEGCGAMWSIHEQTLAYLKQREQFGQALSSFQALQHRIVDVYVDCQLGQSMAWDAVDAVGADRDPRSRKRRVSAAKAYIGDIGRRTGLEGVQLHGGMGMTDDMPVGHYLKRLSAIDMLHGDATFHRNRFRQLDDFAI